jgi:hypothetical protein
MVGCLLHEPGAAACPARSRIDGLSLRPVNSKLGPALLCSALLKIGIPSPFQFILLLCKQMRRDLCMYGMSLVSRLQTNCYCK